jgi:protein-S-isoprenylcysteine O-methyltransferase Ste14
MKLRWRNVPLPEAHLAGIILGMILDRIVPKQLLWARWLGQLLGWPLIVAGAGLSLWSAAEAGEADISSPEALLTEGPYALSRNPMYLGWTLIQAGIASVSNGFWSFVLLPFVVAYTHLVEIRREEDLLEQEFGEAYREYRRRVRR